MKRSFMALATGVFTLGCLFILGPSSELSAQSDLPDAKKVLAKFIEVTGGKMKYAAIKSGHIKAKINIAAAGINGKIDIKFTKDGLMYTKADLGAAGTMERGSDGKTVWEVTTVQGARILEGEEAEQTKSELDFEAMIKPEKKYKSMKTVGKTDVGGEQCYELELTKKSGGVVTEFYSVKTGLKLKSIMEIVSPMGKIKVESFDSDYKKANNGILVARKSEQKMFGLSQKMETTSIEFNVDHSAEIFELPDDVKNLVDDE